MFRYFIVIRDDDFVHRFYDKSGSTHGNCYWMSRPYKKCGYVSYERAIVRLGVLYKKYPHNNLQILKLEIS